jgi:hypothetical protein
VPTKTWVLTDVANRVYVDRLSRTTKDALPLAGSNQWSLSKHRLRGGMSDGVDVIEVNNGRLSFSVLPTRGMGLWKGTCDGLDVGWKSPVALPVNPMFVNAHDRGGLGWLMGFNELLCRCGMDSNGPPGEGATLHGRLANIPAHYVEASVSTEGRGTLSVTGVCDETSLFGPCLRLKSAVSTTAGSNRLTIVDEVTNLSGKEGELEMLYHVNLGRPFLEAGSRVLAPTLEVAPRNPRAMEGIDRYDIYEAPVPGYAEQVYFYDLAANGEGETLVLLRGAHGEKGFSLHFNKKQLPCFSLWKNTQAEADGYCTGIEPGTNYPNPKPYEKTNNRVVMIPPGGTYSIRLEMAVHSKAEEVQAVEQQISTLQRPQPAKVHRTPQAKFSPT